MSSVIGVVRISCLSLSLSPFGFVSSWLIISYLAMWVLKAKSSGSCSLASNNFWTSIHSQALWAQSWTHGIACEEAMRWKAQEINYESGQAPCHAPPVPTVQEACTRGLLEPRSSRSIWTMEWERIGCSSVHMPVTPVLKRLSQEDHRFRASPGYISMASLCCISSACLGNPCLLSWVHLHWMDCLPHSYPSSIF